MSKIKLTFNIDYCVGEGACQITKGIKYRSGRDHTWHILKHSIKKSHKNFNTIDFKIKIFVTIKDNLAIILPILYFADSCWKVTAEILEIEIKVFYILLVISFLKKCIASGYYCL